MLDENYVRVRTLDFDKPIDLGWVWRCDSRLLHLSYTYLTYIMITMKVKLGIKLNLVYEEALSFWCHLLVIISKILSTTLSKQKPYSPWWEHINDATMSHAFALPFISSEFVQIHQVKFNLMKLSFNVLLSFRLYTLPYDVMCVSLFYLLLMIIKIANSNWVKWNRDIKFFQINYTNICFYFHHLTLLIPIW